MLISKGVSVRECVIAVNPLGPAYMADMCRGLGEGGCRALIAAIARRIDREVVEGRCKDALVAMAEGRAGQAQKEKTGKKKRRKEEAHASF